MLERTAGCLESGSLRRLLPGPRKPLKSRRMLHSGFWNHNSVEPELSPLYSALLRGPESADQDSEIQNQTPSTLQAGFLLDFLYPAGTLNFLRQYTGWGIDRQDGRQTRFGIRRLGQRLYTSSATDSSGAENAAIAPEAPVRTQDFLSGKRAETNEPDQDVIMGGQAAQSLRKTMVLTRSQDYEEAWRQYLLLGDSEKNELQRELMQYMSTSGRVLEAERAIEIFEQLDEANRDADAYSIVIRSYLRLRSLSDAVKLYKEALRNLQFPAGASELLSYMIENSLWSQAIGFWKDFQSFRDHSPGLSYNIFSTTQNLSNLIGQAIGLAEYVIGRMETSPESTELITFTSKIVRRALLNPEVDERRFEKLLSFLQEWNFDTSEIYERAFEMLLETKQSRFAVNCYRKVRREREVKFSRPTLHSLLTVFCNNHSVIGMQQILDDFFRFYSKPTRFAYRKCMTEFAAQGDAKTVHALFEQYVARFESKSRLLDAGDIAPILHVHAKRGELAEVIKYFNQFQDVYKLQPNLLCWNILIDAYAKVHDTEGAFESFEKLLESDYLQPDHYTFGTVMGIYATHGDLDRVVEIYRLASSMKIEKSAAMVDCVVLAHIQDERLQQAEKICEDALIMNLKGSKTRMWNYLLHAYAMRRDLVNVNRLLRRMSEAGLDYDQHTYSALMQALAMVKQPDRAYAILQDVMRDAGVRVTSLHYAVVMGGYIANGEYRKVFHLQNRMKRRGIRNSASTKFIAMKAADAEDQKLLESGTEKEQGQRALQMFQEVLNSMDQQDISVSTQKGTHRMPRHIAYTSMFYSYVMFVLGQSNETETVEELYNQFIRTLPEDARDSPPIAVLSAMMLTKLRNRDSKGVQECWDLAVAKAKAQGVPLRPLGRAAQSDLAQLDSFDSSSTYENPKIVPLHQLDLSRSLSTYMISLARQGRSDDIPSVVNGLLEEGFLLDNKNWNLYIQLLAQRYRYKLAFELCEEKLMDGWTGWARLRWQEPVRNRLPIEVRNKKKEPKHLRPNSSTLLFLARGFLELQAMSAESRASQMLLEDLQRTCPRTLLAIRTMQRTDNALEREILRGY
jgi:pentatricopeptide repeat-containing protein PET309